MITAVFCLWYFVFFFFVLVAGQSWKSIKPAGIVATFGSSVNDPGMSTYEYKNDYQLDNNKYGTPDFTGNNFLPAVNGGNREFGVSYDLHGNILSMTRSNSSGSNTVFNYQYISNTNKLQQVPGYATYTYDNIGQMSGQVRSSGQDFYNNYDISGNVTAIYSDAARTVLRTSFAYDEYGMCVRKTDHTLNVNTYYVYDEAKNLIAIYDNAGSALQQKEIPVLALGRIGTYKRQLNKVQFELTDNLGNIRSVINQDKISGLADVIYYADYYPFGTSQGLAVNDYRYGYQGKYAEADKQTGWNNFQLRKYDPRIGRWMSPDRYGQYYSPYCGMGNDPVSEVDPDGGYGLIGGFLKWASTGFKGDFLKSKSGWGKGEWFISTKGDYSESGAGITQNRDFGSYEGDETYRFIMNKVLAETADWRVGHYNEYTKQVNGWGGIKPNYFFEEMFIGGAVAKGAGLLLNRTVVTEGIYEFTASTGLKYVEQSGNISARLEQHIASGLLERGTAVKTTEVLGGRTAREIAEQLRINKLGGVDFLQNVRNPIGKAREHLLP